MIRGVSDRSSLCNSEDKHEPEISAVKVTKRTLSDGDAPPSAREVNVITDLPAEVLREIFFLCCPTYKDHFRGPPLSALGLSQVCRSWRRAAFDSPILWTYLCLVVSYATRGQVERACEQLKFWAERVQNRPLLVNAEFIEPPSGLPTDNILPCVKRLIDAALSCKDSIVRDEMELKAALDATSVPQDLPARYPLVSEQYTWAKSGMRPDRPEAGSVQIHVNRYSEILYGLEDHSALGKHVLHLDLRDPDELIYLSVEECQVVLENFPEVELCAFRVGSFSDEAPEHITLKHLQKLSVSWGDRVDIAVLLNSITTPSLAELELRGPMFPPLELPWIYPLPELLRRSRPSIRTLTLGNMSCNAVNLIHCLAMLEGLENLSLEQCQLDELFMNSLQFGEGLTYDRGRRTILRLKYLSLTRCDIFGLNEFLHSSLDMQIWGEAHLERLYIIDSGWISEDVMEGMKQLALDEFETDPALLDDNLF